MKICYIHATIESPDDNKSNNIIGKKAIIDIINDDNYQLSKEDQIKAYENEEKYKLSIYDENNVLIANNNDNIHKNILIDKQIILLEEINKIYDKLLKLYNDNEEKINLINFLKLRHIYWIIDFEYIMINNDIKLMSENVLDINDNNKKINMLNSKKIFIIKKLINIIKQILDYHKNVIKLTTYNYALFIYNKDIELYNNLLPIYETNILIYEIDEYNNYFKDKLNKEIDMVYQDKILQKYQELLIKYNYIIESKKDPLEKENESIDQNYYYELYIIEKKNGLFNKLNHQINNLTNNNNSVLDIRIEIVNKIIKILEDIKEICNVIITFYKYNNEEVDEKNKFIKQYFYYNKEQFDFNSTINKYEFEILTMNKKIIEYEIYILYNNIQLYTKDLTNDIQLLYKNIILKCEQLDKLINSLIKLNIDINNYDLITKLEIDKIYNHKMLNNIKKMLNDIIKK